MKFTDYLQNNILILDGGFGTLLQESGLPAGELPERWNVSHPEAVTKIHYDYLSAGSDVIFTNTFGANPLKFSHSELDEIVRCAVECAKNARDKAGKENKFIALDIGPTGKLLKPLGDLYFEDAVCAFSEVVRLGVKYGVDLISIETMNDSYETKAALLAAKENSDLPVFVTNAYGEDGKLMTGADADAMTALLEGMGADAVGVNCSLGPKALSPIVKRMTEISSVPVIMKPNAGLPSVIDGKTVFDISSAEFASEVMECVRAGVRIVGGCCGTTPEYIRELKKVLSDIAPLPVEKKNRCTVSSYTHAIIFDKDPVLIGERINPTGKKFLKEALRTGNSEYILSEAIRQAERGAHILDVNVGIPEIDEKTVLPMTVEKIQSVCDLPLQIDTADYASMEAALRVYNGKPLINSVSGKDESMKKIFPLGKKYGGVFIALTLDENGIPETAEGRLKIAEKILRCAAEYGIHRNDIIFDPLCMAVSADKNAANVTLEALKLIKEKLGCRTSLGVSNISFGLPGRESINCAFFSMALGMGLSAAIMNPHSDGMMKTYRSFRALCGLDTNFTDYISAADNGEKSVKAASSELTLTDSIEKGMKEAAESLCREKLKTEKPLDIVNCEIIPSLDRVGKGFEEKKIYLPQLLMSAEAAKAAFECIKAAMPSSCGGKYPVVLATVKGDIHDIGKNIVRLLLENYGYEVTDLGRDVPPEAVVDAVKKTDAKVAGLSALMTTTVPAMEETVRLLRKECPGVLTVVGGAVLTEEYAKSIGATKYAADAMETVRFCDSIDYFGKI